MRSRQSQNGSVSVEAALIMPVLLALVLLFFEIGRVQWHFSSLDHAVQQARRATQLKQEADPNALIEHFSQQLLLHSPELTSEATIEPHGTLRLHNGSAWSEPRKRHRCDCNKG